MISKLLLIFLGLIILRIIYNLYYLAFSNYYLHKYYEYLSNKNMYFLEHKQSIVSLFKKAGIEDAFIPFVEAIGYGQIATNTASVFSNIGNQREDVVGRIVSWLTESRAVFKERIFHTLNPIKWIEGIIFLPRSILHYLGVSPERVIVKILNIIWWMVGIVFSVLLIFFKDWLYELIKTIVDNKN